MERTILAYLTVDEDRAFKETDGPVSYVDEDAEDPKERYLVYLARFAFEHLSDGNVTPLSYAEWRRR